MRAMKRALLLALCIVPIASCGEPEVEPVTGTWTIVNSAPSMNTCGDAAEASSGDFLLTNNGDGTFTVDPQDGTEAFHCTIDGDAFTCPERLQETVTQAGIDAKVDIKVSASGTFSSNTAASGQQDLVAVCTGSQCGLVESALGFTLPCGATAPFTTSLKK